MMGHKTVEPKLYMSFSLDAAVPVNHLVRRLASVVDFDFVRGLVRRDYSHTGQPSVDPIVLFKLWLLGYLFNITSERRLCEEASLNLAWRWFLGYELDEPLPDHSVLSKARKRFGVRVYEKFFHHIVRLCESAGLVEGDVLFIDSTLSKANAAPQSLRSRALLAQRLPDAGKFLNELWVVNEDSFETNGSGGKQRPELGGKRTDSRRSAVNDYCVSPTDPDAQKVVRPGKPAVLGHKTHFLVDGGKANVITAVEVRPAGESDGQAVGRALDKHRLALSRSPRELVGDRGYGSQVAVQACVARDVQPLLGVRTPTNPHGGLDRSEFTYLAENDLYICPEGKQLRRVGENYHRHQTMYKIAKGACRDCPLKPRCAPGPTDRMVSRRWDATVVEAMQERLQSRRGRRLLQRRGTISERINADAKEKHGMAKAQFRGRVKMQMQALLTATAINLKMLAKGGPEAQSGVAATVGVRPLLPCSDHRTRVRAFGWTRRAVPAEARHLGRRPCPRRPR